MPLTWTDMRRATARRGMTLIEVLVAVTILTVLVWGTVAFLTNCRVSVERANQRRAAAQVAIAQLEEARAVPYAALDDDSGTTALNGTSYTWSLDVTETQADPADPNSLYKEMTVTVEWANDAGAPVVVASARAP